ncbi:MAG TPA: TIGR02300 family protein, partial [Alphaproteobacteria bacterium]|nr:TIGR02300 family protein [Alphaproteobacteria bacterium]
MAKPEWGTKRQCPSCGTRFYDLQQDDPIICINCSHEFMPEILLKPRRTRPEEPPQKKEAEKPDDDDDDDDILDDDDDEDISLESLDDD